MNINKMTKAQLIQHISDIEQHNVYLSTENDKLTKAVAQLTAAKTYPTPKPNTSSYVDQDKQEVKANANRTELPPRPVTVKQITKILTMFCTHRYTRFALPADFNARTAMQVINYMENTTLKTERYKPNKADYADMDLFYADQNAFYAPQHEWAKALSKKYSTEAGKIQIALNRFKDPTAYAAQCSVDNDIKERYSAFYDPTH